MQARSWLLAVSSVLALARASSAQGTGEINAAEAAGPGPEAATAGAQPVNGQEREALNILHNANQAEIEAGRMATRRARSVTIKRFGQLMKDSQTHADRELQTIARQNNVQLQRATNAQLEELKRTWDPALFDRRFLNLMARNQTMSIRATQAAQASAQSPSVQAYLSKTLPKLEKHKDATLMQLRNSPF